VSIETPQQARQSDGHLDYRAVEGLPPAGFDPPTAPPADGDAARQWLIVAIALVGLVALCATLLAAFAFAGAGGGAKTTTVVHKATATPAAAPAKAPTLADAKGVKFEKFAPVDPTLPAVPPGPVKKFTVDVFQHVTQVAPDLAPTEAWSYTVNGKAYPARRRARRSSSNRATTCRSRSSTAARRR
jgi:hypothetical protein